MRKLIRILVTVIAIIIAGYLLSQIIHEQRTNSEISAHIKNLPDISFASLNNDTINLISLAANRPVMIIYFSTECDYCQEEATLIRKNIADFNSVAIIMISPFPAKDVAEFARNYHLSNLQNVYFLLDQKEKFYKTFGVQNFPTLFIYNRQHQLVKQFIGETDIKHIINALHQ